MENLTQKLAEASWELFRKVEEKGGMASALAASFPQNEISAIACKKRENLSTRKDIFVGTNMYSNLLEKPLEKRSADGLSVYQERKNFMENFRTSGEINKHMEPLQKLSEVQKAGPETRMETLINAAFSSASLGEMSSTLRQNRGEIPRVEPLHIHRGAEIFEGLRHAMDIYRNRHGRVPKVFLANMGPVSQHKARADFSTGFFQVAGFEVITNSGFETPQQAAEAAVQSGAAIVVICSTDPTYPELVPLLVSSIKKEDADIQVILAGYPKDQIEAHMASGVDDFVYVRANAYEIFVKLLKKTGVIA